MTNIKNATNVIDGKTDTENTKGHTSESPLVAFPTYGDTVRTSEEVRFTFSVAKGHLWYAFKSDSLIPGATKIGDTTRDVPTRLGEWQRSDFPDLEMVATGDLEILPGVYVRDHALHKGIASKGYHQLQAHEFTDGRQHTTEAYSVSPDDARSEIQDVIGDIRAKHGSPSAPYTYYSVDSDKKQIGLEHYPRDPFDWTLRPIQLEAVDNSENAVMMGIDTMLLDASVRFGKCLTTLSVAERLGLKRILVTSGKADVEEEWKKAVEIPGQFKGWGFVSPDLLRTSDSILDEMEKEYDVIVVFMTLQDSWNAEDKRRYAQILSRKWDLLAVDETHYGARAEKFSQAIDGISRSYTLHLSGSPFRILASQEFSPEQIVACKTRADMIAEREAWDEAHADEIASGTIAPWTNPYYGIPTPVTMALLGDDETSARIRALSEDGITINFRELLATDHNPKSPKFVHEPEIRSLLEMIDGRDKTLGFLNFDIAGRNDLFRHMVWCLPERDSCDAMEDLLGKMIEEGRFQHLIDYVTINVAGNHAPKEYQVPGGTRQVVRDIAQTAVDGDKTISLTVYRMLTGVTVPEWDTMLMLTNTENAEFYEQATGRLMSPFTQTVVNEDDKNDTYKVNRKPYVVIVDFDPARVFRIAEQRSIAQRITGKGIDEAVAHEMRYAPIITANKDGFKRVTSTDLRKAISRYSTAGIADEVKNIPVDNSMLADWDFVNAIRDFHESSVGRREIEVDPFEEQGDTLDIPEVENDKTNSEATVDGPDDQGADGRWDDGERDDKESEKARQALVDKIRDFYFRSVAFAAAWQKGQIKTLEDVRIKAKTTKTGRTIAGNLGILDDIDTLCDAVGRFPNISLRLDSAIYNISTLVNDEELSGMEKARILMERFGRLSSSEVATPAWVARKMVDAIPDEAFQKDEPRFLDLASKVGEMAYALVGRCGRIEKETGRKVTPEIRSVTTSPVAYVLTVATYRLLNLDYRQVAKFTSYDLLGKDIKTMAKTLRQDKDFYQIDLFDLVGGGMSASTMGEATRTPADKPAAISDTASLLDFDAVVSNPPYQSDTKGTSDKPIYHEFIQLGYECADIAVFISPGRFLFNAGKTPKVWNRQMLEDTSVSVPFYESKSTLVFPDVDIKGGIAITLRNQGKNGEAIGTFIPFHELQETLRKVKVYPGFATMADWIYAPESYKFTPIFHQENPWARTRLSKGHDNDVVTNVFRKLPEIFTDTLPAGANPDEYVQLWGLQSGKRHCKYVRHSYIKGPDNFESWKVILPKSNGSGALGEVLSTPLVGAPLVGAPLVGATQTFLTIGTLSTKEEANSLLKYIKTTFCRVLLGTLKVTQDNKKAVWANVPLQDFTPDSDIDWSKTIDEIDEQLFDKYDLDETERNFIKTHVQKMD